MNMIRLLLPLIISLLHLINSSRNWRQDESDRIPVGWMSRVVAQLSTHAVGTSFKMDTKTLWNRNVIFFLNNQNKLKSCITKAITQASLDSALLLGTGCAMYTLKSGLRDTMILIASPRVFIPSVIVASELTPNIKEWTMLLRQSITTCLVADWTTPRCSNNVDNVKLCKNLNFCCKTPSKLTYQVEQNYLFYHETIFVLPLEFVNPKYFNSPV